MAKTIDWDNMKCSLYYYKNDANRYANLLISLTNSKSNRDKYRQLYSHYDNIKFCPGEVNGDISRDILYSWINTLKNRLEEQGLLNLFMFVLGHLFSYSPKGKDGIIPHEYIREYIEEYGNDDQISSFETSVICKRGVYFGTNGKAEYNLCIENKIISEKLQIQYPKTAKIYAKISEHYKYDSEKERTIAEDILY